MQQFNELKMKREKNNNETIIDGIKVQPMWS